MSFILRRAYSIATAVKNTKTELDQLILTGRDFIVPDNLRSDEIKSLLWTALDLMYCQKQNVNVNFSCVKNRHVTLLMEENCTKSLLSLGNATRMMDVLLNVLVDNTWDKRFVLHSSDYAQILTCYSDIIFCKNKEQANLQKLADGSEKPVINIQSSDFNIVQVLTDLMTVQVRYGHLKGLTFAWVGEGGPLLNAYFCILPRLGINMKYFLIGERTENLCCECINVALKNCQKHNCEIHECTSVSQATHRADVITTSHHCNNKYTITMKHVKEAALNWSLLHPLPRGAEVEDAVFKHKNSLVWKSLKNLEWVYAALIIRFLKHYEHATAAPTFDDIEASPKQ